MYLLWIVIFLNKSLSVVRGQPCTTSGWFGDNCQYKCHCTGNNYCDFTTGDCTGGSACVKGWFGPACQYVDLTTTETRGTGWLYDGDDNTCNDGQQSVTVQLNDPVPFTWLRLYVKDPGNIDTFNIQFQTSTGGNVVNCTNKKTAAVNDRTLDIYCDLMVVQQVIFTGQAVRSLCSVYISGGRNVALEQLTTQSTTFSSSPTISTASFNAVDGDRSGNWSSGSCTETGFTDSDPSWSVTFRHPQTINRYLLYNRNDAVPWRLLYFNLTSYAQDGRQVFTYQDQKTQPQYVYTVIPDVTSTSPVSSVTIRATYVRYPPPVLTLCEVETYGDTICPQGKYGRECEHNCDYCRNQICFVSTGGCHDGCDDGFVGVRCQTNCPHTTYGQDCKETCSTNCVDQDCNPVSGVCVLCPSGKMGDQCDRGLGAGGSAAIGVSVTLAICLIIAGISIYCFRRWQKHSARRQQAKTYAIPQQSGQEEHGYAVATREDERQSTATDTQPTSADGLEGSEQYQNIENVHYEEIGLERFQESSRKASVDRKYKLANEEEDGQNKNYMNVV